MRKKRTIAAGSAKGHIDPEREFQVYKRICGTRRKADLADRLAALIGDCALAAAGLRQGP